MNIGVTGGAGFIGSKLVRRLLELGHEVKVIDDLSTGRLENLENCDISLIAKSITDIDALEEFILDIDIVFHLAALGSVPRSIMNPRSSFEANVIGSFNLLEVVRKKNIPSVFISSSSVYGNLLENPKIEERVGTPLSPYAATKFAMEKFVESYRNAFDSKVLVFRLFNVFGPNQRFDHEYSAVIPKWINLAIQGKPIEVYGDGSITRDFTFVDEVVDVFVQSIEKIPLFNEMKLINLAFGRSISLNDISNCLLQHFPGIKVEYKPTRSSDILNSTSSPNRLYKYFPNLEAKPFEHYFEETLHWINLNSKIPNDKLRN